MEEHRPIDTGKALDSSLSTFPSVVAEHPHNTRSSSSFDLAQSYIGAVLEISAVNEADSYMEE